MEKNKDVLYFLRKLESSQSYTKRNCTAYIFLLIVKSKTVNTTVLTRTCRKTSTFMFLSGLRFFFFLWFVG